MSELAGAIAAAAPAAGQEPPAAPNAPAAGQEPPAAPAAPDWMGGLADEALRGNDRLAHYKTVTDLAKGFLETETWARGRIALPKDGDDAAFAEFAGKLRPESADKYALDLGDKADAGMTEWFKGAAFDSGMHPVQAQKLATAWNQHMADVQAKITQTASDELKAIELENPAGFHRAAAAIDTMLRKGGLLEGDNASAIDTLQAAFGAGKAFGFLRQLATMTGELERVDGASVDMALGAMKPDAASAERLRMMSDPAIAPKLRDPNSPEAVKFRALQAIEARGA